MATIVRRAVATGAALLFVAALALPAQQVADTAGPRAGTWGAEATFGQGPQGTLLRFTSPSAAWLVSAVLSSEARTFDDPNFGPSGFISSTQASESHGAVQLSVGRRWYRGDMRERLRPTVGLGATGAYGSSATSDYSSYGAYGEAGSTYFFTPHLSLGASGVLSFLRSTENYGDEFANLSARATIIRLDLVHVTGAVYF